MIRTTAYVLLLDALSCNNLQLVCKQELKVYSTKKILNIKDLIHKNIILKVANVIERFLEFSLI